MTGDCAVTTRMERSWLLKLQSKTLVRMTEMQVVGAGIGLANCLIGSDRSYSLCDIASPSIKVNLASPTCRSG